MPDFKFKGNRLYCEDVDLERILIIDLVSCVVYSRKALLESFNEIKDAVKEHL